MKRQEAITFLKQLQYSILKLTGVAEMKAGAINRRYLQNKKRCTRAMSHTSKSGCSCFREIIRTG